MIDEIKNKIKENEEQIDRVQEYLRKTLAFRQQVLSLSKASAWDKKTLAPVLKLTKSNMQLAVAAYLEAENAFMSAMDDAASVEGFYEDLVRDETSN